MRNAHVNPVMLVLLALSGFLVALLGMEGILRAFGPNWLRLRMSEINAGQQQVFFDSDQGWPVECAESMCYRYAPGSTFRVVTREYSHSVSIDEYGARATSPAGLGDSHVTPFLGDSFTFGVGVEDDETFVSLLDLDLGVDYLNLGIPGNSLPQHIDIVEKRHNELGAPPLHLFAFFIGNDFQNIVETRNDTRIGMSTLGAGDGERQYPTLSSRFHGLSRVNIYVLRDPVLRRLYVIQWFRHKVLLLVNRANADLMDPIFLVTRKDRTYLDDAGIFLEQELQRLTSIARKLQFDVAFVILPDRHQVNSDLLDLKSAYYGVLAEQIDARIPNSVLAKALAAHDIPYVDITDCMAERDDVDALYYKGDNHFTARGHRAAAECMAPGLEELDYSKHSQFE